MKKLLCLFAAITVACSSGDDSTTPDNNDPQNSDTTPPVITLIGESTITVYRGEPYIDEGAIATDDVDGDITSAIFVNDGTDYLQNGQYEIVYSVTDNAGNQASVERIIIVTDDGNPCIGDLVNGGVVYWVNPDDRSNGLVAAIEPLNCGSGNLYTKVRWSSEACEGSWGGPYSIGGNDEIGGGEENTNYILGLNEICGNALYAAKFARLYCGGGYQDWYLPNRRELYEWNIKYNLVKEALQRSGFQDNLWFANFGAGLVQNRIVWTSVGIISSYNDTAHAYPSNSTSYNYFYGDDDFNQDSEMNASLKTLELNVLPIRMY